MKVKNNSELVKAVKSLQDVENKYIIVFDNSFDNLQVVMEQKRLKKYAKECLAVRYHLLRVYSLRIYRIN